jgi:hypothetical protein
VPPAADEAAADGGWQSWCTWNNGAAQPIASFEARWTVPVAPVSANGQTIYLFNGLLDAGGTHILQPVLQWGRSPAVGSTNARGLSSFWVGGQNDMMFTTDWVTVAPGDVVIGRMTVNPQGNGLVSCTTEFDGYSRRPCGQTTGSPPSNSRQTLPNCEVKSRTETEQICKLTANRRKPVLSTK